VAHFYLTTQLIALLQKAPTSRVVTVSSVGHRGVLSNMDLKNISNPKTYGRFGHYAKSKV
jgi:NAD(P)-dependent dehydrogenase (short-subunit alcohol dehydrogenase family)